MRIIAGSHRGRPIRAPKGQQTRPTTDRVREALFAILGDIRDAEVLDCYAGSGALGLEAVSRGARRATFIESGRAAADTISGNVRSLSLEERCTVLRVPVERSGKALGAARFDLVLSDPPWPICQAAALAVVDLVGQRLNPGAVVVLGHPYRQSLELERARWSLPSETRHWGDSAMTLFFAEDTQGGG